MSTEMQTVTTTADYHVLASDQLIFTNQPAFQLSQPTISGHWANPSPHLWISGEVDVVINSTSTAGSFDWYGIVISNTFDSTPYVTLDPGATLKMSVVGGGAIGYFAGGSDAPSTFDNAGTIFVSADGHALGVGNGGNNDLLINSGLITVTSNTSDATGLKVQNYGMTVQNSGYITVSGHGQVIGVDMGPSGGAEVFHNTGTIVAHDDNTALNSVGVFWGNGPQTGGGFVNDGTIEADRALDVYITYGTADENLITNNGRMVGDVWLSGGGPETLANNGVITGAIRLIGAGSVYDGRLGLAQGPITGSNNGGNTLLGGDGAETITGGFHDDSISGGAGGDVITDASGNNNLDGDAGDDTIMSGAGADFIRGLEGNDSIDGGAGADDVNGNRGDDIVHGGDGIDFTRGGQGDDQVYGDAGDDLHVNGNIGNDTVHGGDGADSVYGGQGDDQIYGDAGDDYLSGDLGSDTLTGGAGADTFHLGVNSSHDYVTDFSAAEGDRVLLDHGSAYTVTWTGSDSVVTLSTGEQLTLQGIDSASLPSGWLVVS